ncbi:hypothetical protein [Paenibacillus sp. OV219]|uniref:hypothetical protein n=1 Tax=Paenibacillus sp. OV219 TaxID=1884377 RepID=UPI0008C5CDA9|nr:hypothetical protein [Paenibacillus sp. OV219]SEP11155.1 hypothetical protein SAMN05518847_11738 [Paenibacillus sp. OV219]
MPEVIAVGPLRLDSVLLAALIAGAAGFIAIKLKLTGTERSELWGQLYVNAAIITLLSWKLLFLLREPSMLWERPSSLVIVRGSGFDAMNGFAASIVYIAYVRYRRRIPSLVMLDTWPFALIPACLAWTLLTDLRYGIGYVVLYALVYAAMLRVDAEAGSGRLASIALLGSGLGGLLVSLFAPYAPGVVPELTLGLTRLQWLFVGCGLVGALLPLSEPARDKDEHKEKESRTY